MTTAPAPAAQPPAAARLRAGGPRGRTAWLAGLLVLACLLAYHNSLEGPFIFDDHQSIEENPNARSIWPLTRSMTAPPASGVAGRPVVSLSIAINYAVGGLDVTGYHVANLLFHVLSALLLFGIVRRTTHLLVSDDATAQRSPGLRAWAFADARDADGAAFAIALLWAVHPLLTESVTYVIQRTELLMGMSFLATLYCFIRGATETSRTARVAWLAASVLSCALGMGSKEVMVAAPLVVLVYDRLFIAGSFLRAMRLRWPYYLPLALTLAIIPALLLTTVALRSKTGAGLESITAWDNLKTQAGVIAHYLRLAIWPSGLTIDYDDWPIARSLADVLPQALLIVALLALTGYGLWRGWRIAFLGAWFFLILAPTSSFLPLGTEIAGERRMYLPTVAVVALAVLGGRAALGWLARRLAWRPASARLAGALSILIVAGALLVTTVARNDDYRSAAAIYADAAAKRPNNARAMMNLGVALDHAGQTDAARSAFQEALRRKPNYADAHYNLGAVLLQQGDADAAAPHLFAAMQGRPAWPLPYLRLGQVLEAKGYPADARQMYDKARALAGRAGQRYLVDEIDARIAALPPASPP